MYGLLSTALKKSGYLGRYFIGKIAFEKHPTIAQIQSARHPIMRCRSLAEQHLVDQNRITLPHSVFLVSSDGCDNKARYNTRRNA